MQLDDHQIFIGYRRDDTRAFVGRIHDHLEYRFGEGKIFRDIDSLGVGVPFMQRLSEAIPRCRVFLALMGPSWLNARHQNGRRRLDDEYDPVRMELEIAFSVKNLLVVPVLINDATMPLASDLPQTISALPTRNAARIRCLDDHDFRSDMRRLLDALEPYVDLQNQPPQSAFSPSSIDAGPSLSAEVPETLDDELAPGDEVGREGGSARDRRFVEMLDELHVDALRYLVRSFNLTPTSLRERSALVECLVGSRQSKKRILLELSRPTLVELMRKFDLPLGYNPDKRYMASELLKLPR